MKNLKSYFLKTFLDVALCFATLDEFSVQRNGFHGGSLYNRDGKISLDLIIRFMDMSPDRVMIPLLQI